MEDYRTESRNRTPNRRWKAPLAMVAVVAAVLVVSFVALPTFLTSPVLAYSYSVGSYTYGVSYFSATDHESTGEGSIIPGPDVSTEAEGTVTYTVEDNSNTETKTIGIRADVTGGNNLDGTFEDMPEVRFVIDSDGGLVEMLAPGPEVGIPGFVLPEALPGSSRGYGGLPFGFGPEFPDRPLDVGDSWTTTGPRGALAEDGPQYTAEHRVIGEETVAGRETIVITSLYETPAFETDHADDDMVAGAFYGPESSEVTVWFDPAAGIIVRAELDRTNTGETRFDNGQILTTNGTTRIVVELVTDS